MSTLDYSLKLQNPDDLKKIADFAIAVTKEYSIRDLGYEMIPNNEEDLYAGCGLLVNENSIGWYDDTCHSKHMDYFRLIGEVALRYPDVPMTLYTSFDPEESSEWKWDGEKWHTVAVYDLDENGDMIERKVNLT